MIILDPTYFYSTSLFTLFLFFYKSLWYEFCLNTFQQFLEIVLFCFCRNIVAFRDLTTTESQATSDIKRTDNGGSTSSSSSLCPKSFVR